MSLYDTIAPSKVSKKSRYFKKFCSTENLSFLVKSVLNLQTGVIFEKTKNPFCIWTTKRVYYKNLIFFNSERKKCLLFRLSVLSLLQEVCL